jgi:hypothetical protein
MKSPFARLTLALLVLVLLACACVAPPLSDRLIFQVEVAENMSGELDISLQVRNAGQGVASARPEANAVMELRDAHNILRARADVVHLIAIDPGDILNPLVWRGRLDPGMYRLYWGAPGLGHTQVEFMLSQQDGRQRLEELRTMTTPDQDMPTLPTYGDAQPLVDLASVQLAGQLGVESGLIRVERVEPVDFPDASLGAPQPDMMYAQVITPGYVIELSHQGQSFVFHGDGQQVVPVPAEDAGRPPEGSITIESVQVDGEQVMARGRSTLPDGTCLGSELWAGGELAAWWPADVCAQVDRGAWQLVVPLGVGQAPAALDPDVQYMLRAFLPGGPNIVSVFAFDLAGPPAPDNP